MTEYCTALSVAAPPDWNWLQVVPVGVIWLWTLFTLAVRGKIPKEKALDVEIAGLYWHFVDVVWIAIFTLVYLIQ